MKGLALSGGGARGSFQVGALEYLYKVEGYRPDVIASTSVGSINALVLAQGDTPGAQLKQLNILLGVWRGLSRPTQFYMLRQWAADLLQSDGIDLGALSIDMGHAIEQIVFHDLIGQATHSPSLALLDPLEAVIRPLVDAKALGGGVPLRMVTVSLETGRIRYVTGRGLFLEDDNFTPVASALPDVAAIKGPRDTFMVELTALRAVQAMIEAESDRQWPDTRGKWETLAKLRIERERAQWRAEAAFDALAAANSSLPTPIQATVDPVTGALASSGLPGIFGPYRLGEEHYVDGGVRENVPVRPVVQMGATEVIAVACSSQSLPHAGDAGSQSFFMNLLESLSNFMQKELVEQDLAGRGVGNVPVTVIMPSFDVHDGAVVDPGLIHISMDYGFLRAADAMHPMSDAERLAARTLSDAIAAVRRETHLLSYLWHRPLDPDAHGMLLELRFRKWVLRKLVESRVESGVGLPQFATTWFQGWEVGSSGVPNIPNPWSYFTTLAETTPQVDPMTYVPDLFTYEEKGDLSGVYVVRLGAAFRGTAVVVGAVTGTTARPGITLPAGTTANLPAVPVSGSVLAEVAPPGAGVQTPGTWIVDDTRRYLLNAAALAKLGAPAPTTVPSGGLAQIPSGGSPFWLGGLVVADSQPSMVREWDPTPQVEGSRTQTAVILWNNGSTGRTTTVSDMRITTPADTAQSPVFTVKTPLPFQVAQGAVLRVDVAFDAHTPGMLSGLVTVVCDDPIAPEIRIPLASSVTPLGGHAELQLSPAQLDLGQARVTATVGADVLITNTGSRPASIGASIADEQPVGQFGVSAFSLIDPLPPGATTSVHASYVPTTRGPAHATLAVDLSSQTDLGSIFHHRYEVPLTGRGTAPVVYLSDLPLPRRRPRFLPPEPAALDFGAGALNTVLHTSFWICNVGDASLTVSGIAIAGQASFGVDDVTSFPVTLTPFGQVEVACSFATGAIAGVGAGGELEIYSDDPIRPTASLRVVGRAAGPHLSNPGELLDLGQVAPQATGTLTYTSDGSDPVRVRNAKLATGQDFSIATAPAVPATVAPGDSFVVTVKVTATDPGRYLDQLFVIHDGAPSGTSAALIRAEEA